MCLSIPAKIVEINEQTAKVSFAGAEQDISIVLVDDIKAGDYVIVHAGFALEKISDKAAKETIAMLNELIIEE